MKIGVLALQGAVAEHMVMMTRAGAEAVPVKRTDELAELDGLIIPGGESTTIGKLIRTYGFTEPLREFSMERRPIFGTCAGLIILAKQITGQADTHLNLMDIRVARNAFGRQRESFETDLPVKGIEEPIRAVFIRAPLIEEVGEGVEVLAKHRDDIVAARQEHLLAASFHPELTEDHRLHAYFADMVRKYRR
ncbi:pyridoxal 5'-phosphate synthase glutaminase subunit PdxT [Gorillibacterium timonense]|uniref:pyridoxal 5'-phosphate synthase glutaminase subunit PdxT n=1 Tax=Gorillibacterium timonense TaxID=1689269 RepID=UPI00071DBB98|nr:pyridoxal 5'-phosphate synthase glutaminase subunit PdxT [Gorillibacterium timonense]